jgi:hypothetical protein
MARQKCTATKVNGEPCQSFAVRDGLCQAHCPERAGAHKEASRRGGEHRSAYRRAARQWADKGRQIRDEDLPAILRACLFDVRAGRMEPSVASAIATLAKTALQLSADLDLERRIVALEEAAGVDQSDGKIRRIA